MNILKPQLPSNTTNYNKLSKALDFDILFKRITNEEQEIKYRFFSIKKDKNILSLTSHLNSIDLHCLSIVQAYLSEDQKVNFSQLYVGHTINAFYKKKILTLLHLDVMMCYDKLKSDTLSPVESLELINYLKYNSGIENIENLLKTFSMNNEERSNIHGVNKSSTVVDLIDNRLNQNDNLLSLDNVKLIKSNLLINNIELQSGFDNEKLNLVLKEINDICAKVLIRQPTGIHHKFSLKFRKIKRTLKNGMYITATNTIVVDPRHTDSFLHELGHWYHTFYQPKITNTKEAEVFAENFELNVVDNI